MFIMAFDIHVLFPSNSTWSHLASQVILVEAKYDKYIYLLFCSNFCDWHAILR